MKSKVINKTKNTAFNLCKKAAAEYDCSIVSEDFSTGQLNLKKAGGFFSYGNQINIAVLPIEQNVTKIEIQSNSVGIQIIDWGTNNEIELFFVEYITNSNL